MFPESLGCITSVYYVLNLSVLLFVIISIQPLQRAKETCTMKGVMVFLNGASDFPLKDALSLEGHFNRLRLDLNNFQKSCI